MIHTSRSAMIGRRRYKLIYLLLLIGYVLYGVLMFRIGLDRREGNQLAMNIT